jgi:hypothetical protein
MNAKLKLAALAGAAVMVVPGAGLIQNAVAAGGATGSATTEQQAPELVPTQTQQQEQPDRPRPEDCPEKDGQGGGGSGSGSSGDSGASGSGTAL